MEMIQRNKLGDAIDPAQCTLCNKVHAVLPNKAKTKTQLPRRSGCLLSNKNACCGNRIFERGCVEALVQGMQTGKLAFHKEFFEAAISDKKNWIYWFYKYSEYREGRDLNMRLPDNVPCPMCCVMEACNGDATTLANTSILIKNHCNLLTRGKRHSKKRKRNPRNKNNKTEHDPLLAQLGSKKTAHNLGPSNGDLALSFVELPEKGFNRQKVINALSESSNSLAGMLYFPAYHLLIDPCLGLEQLHGMAGQTNGKEDGCWHSVVPEEVAAAVDMTRFEGHPKKTKRLALNQNSTDHPLPLHKIDPQRWPSGQSYELKVEWSAFKLDRDIDCSRKKGQYPKADELMFCQVFRPSDSAKVSVALLEPRIEDADFHLGSMILQDPAGSPILERPEHICQDALFDNMLPSTGTKGIQVARSGGSGGPVDTSSNLLKTFLLRLRTFPVHRRAMPLLIVNYDGRSPCIIGLYIKVQERKRIAALYKYAMPRHGGKICFGEAGNYCHLENSAVLQRFPACRVICAIICSQYNNLKSTRRHVISNAIANQLAKWELAKTGSNPLLCLAMEANHTLVTHPVGLHRDFFENKGTDQIENKIVLVSWRFSCTEHMKTLGRGGAPGLYTFAILDW
ncbi:unnamed protein product [Cylindrotheca closterium]|uniref:Uncharacterized protein n=1 Tax=Cylindrotheca closterium TaxID=2856 RepID=A0AAD2CKS7_9STRA|nr:unnamed protein product [Cylindrotheca closterium]